MQPTHQAVISNPKLVNSFPLRQSPSSRRKPHATVWPTPDADPEDFSRRLKISLSPSPGPCQSTKARKLFNPDTDPIPMRRTADPEPLLESTQQGPCFPPPSSTNHRDERGNPARHLFHPKDDLVRFARPQLSTPGRPSPTLKPLCICFLNFILCCIHFFICLYPLVYNRWFIHLLRPLRWKTKSRPSQNQCFL